MKKSQLLPFVLWVFVAFAMWASDSLAYDRYNDGCQNCHGAFTDGTSPKGSTIPSDDKHTMHRSSNYMGATCDLCHTAGDGRDPFIGSSNGTGNNPGLGCTGCHGRNQDRGNDGISSGRGAGLRQHHTDAGVDNCTNCHTDADPANYTPVGEQVFPRYYGTADTNADEPCNPMAQANINENWTIGDFLGLDNDGDGDYDTADPDCVVNQPPTADPNGPYNGTVGEQVAFDGSGSVDPDGTIDAYAWDFGDGNIGTGVSPAHTYGTAGTYTVTLTVTDNDGGNDTATTTATISDVPQLPPVADPNGPYTGAVGAPVQFDGSGSVDPDGTIVSYAWDFGDGSTGAGVNPAHLYVAAGSYTVALTVTDNDGLSDTATTTATITDVPQPPVADPNGPYTGAVGAPVQFDGSGSVDPDGTIVNYAWDFGDGSTGAGVNPAHLYVAAGSYTVALTVTDNDSLTDTGTTTATITDVPLPPVADPNGPYTGSVGDPVQFDGLGSNDPDGTIVNYAWDFGDGNTGTGANPAHTYAALGTYTVALTVTDNDNLTDTATTTATIADVPPQPPVADPNGPYSGTVGDPVQFDGSGSFDPDGTIVSYLWDFSDGSTGAGLNPTHIYSTAGTYTVALTVTDNDGLTNTSTTTATIPNQIEADVFLKKLKAPKNLKMGRRAVSKKITAVGEADTKAQDATVTLSWEMVPMGLVNIIVSPNPPSITKAVTPGKGSDRFKFNTDIACNQSATQGTITWTAQIDAPENRDTSNDVVTATSNVTCR